VHWDRGAPDAAWVTKAEWREGMSEIELMRQQVDLSRKFKSL
jgi:hypothetical protein